MTENKADPLREALECLAASIDTRINNLLCETKPNYDDSLVGINDAWDVVRKACKEHIARYALARDPQPAAPLGGRDEIARIIFGKACGLSRWDDAFYAEERHGCLETADAILAAIPQERGVVERLLQDTLAEYEQTVEVAEKDTALSDTGRQRVIECCLDARGVVKVFAARLLAQPPTANVVAGTDRAAIIEECVKAAESVEMGRKWSDDPDMQNQGYYTEGEILVEVVDAIRALGKETDQ